MNFALILLILLVVTGALLLLDRMVLRRGRIQVEGQPEPWWVDYSRSFFPVILVVFLLRSFIVEPFRIPSGSMLPTLFIGDFILVNKFSYGIRLPVVNWKVLDVGEPQRGDVLVFRYPKDPSVDFIKRLVGLPGDRISYVKKRLTINGTPVESVAMADFINRERYQVTHQFTEQFGDRTHRILIDPDAPDMPPFLEQFPHRENCSYTAESVTCTVPPGHYFMMGDNRDNSQDSRVWGFVPDTNVVGRAFYIWMNFGDMGRIGRFD